MFLWDQNHPELQRTRAALVDCGVIEDRPLQRRDDRARELLERLERAQDELGMATAEWRQFLETGR